MKIVWFAFTLCFTLIGIIAFVAWQAHLEARSAREEVLLFRQRAAEQLAAGAAPVPGILETPPSAPALRPPAPPPASASISIQGGAPAGSPATITPPPAKFDAASAPVAITPPAGEPGEETPTQPPPLTAQQKQVMGLPAIAKVKEAFPNDGFVLIDAGSRKNLAAGMQFALRRGAAIIARVTVTESIEEDESIADIQPRTLAVGVTPMAGDEVVQVVAAP